MADEFYCELAEAITDSDMEALKQELIEGKHADQAMAQANQMKIAAANDRIERAFVDGLGQCTMQVDLTAYLLWQLREPGCWSDKQFRREFMRDNPSARVKSRSSKTQISFNRS